MYDQHDTSIYSPERLKDRTGSTHTELLAKHAERPIYIMDNHGLAAYCWHQELGSLRSSPLHVLHIDAHADWGPSGYSAEDCDKLKDSLGSLRNYLNVSDNYDRFYWQWDSYFSSYLYVAGSVSEVHAYVPTWEYDKFDHHCTPAISVKCWDLLEVELDLRPFYDIVNIDIDAFCCPGESGSDNDIPYEGWEGRVHQWAKALRAVIDRASAVTIALSPTTTNDGLFNLDLTRSYEILNYLLSSLSLESYSPT